MDRGPELVISEFTIKAQKLFMFAYGKFRLSTKKLDRQNDDNVFQLQLGKYLNTLKSELEGVASELLRSNPTENIDHCNKLLKDKIDIYLREFRQKARLL